MIFLFQITGLVAATLGLAAVLWSAAKPLHGIWPPRQRTRLSVIAVWGLTTLLVASLLMLGILDWGTADIPAWQRWGIAPLLLVVSNIAVWAEALDFGPAQTMGARGTLKTTGLYRYSRNPQYVADAVMVVGWLLLSAAPAATPLGIVTVVLLLVTPLTEEPWLESVYGDAYRAYRSQVRRYL